MIKITGFVLGQLAAAVKMEYLQFMTVLQREGTEVFALKRTD